MSEDDIASSGEAWRKKDTRYMEDVINDLREMCDLCASQGWIKWEMDIAQGCKAIDSIVRKIKIEKKYSM